jgi:hypothetical protein
VRRGAGSDRDVGMQGQRWRAHEVHITSTQGARLVGLVHAPSLWGYEAAGGGGRSQGGSACVGGFEHIPVSKGLTQACVPSRRRSGSGGKHQAVMAHT